MFQGAGDTVIAVLSMALVANGNFQESAQLANLAAGIVVGKVGTATVTAEEIFLYYSFLCREQFF